MYFKIISKNNKDIPPYGIIFSIYGEEYVVVPLIFATKRGAVSKLLDLEEREIYRAGRRLSIKEKMELIKLGTTESLNSINFPDKIKISLELSSGGIDPSDTTSYEEAFEKVQEAMNNLMITLEKEFKPLINKIYLQIATFNSYASKIKPQNGTGKSNK